MDMCIAVSSGSCSLDLSLRNPKKIAHSGSLTLANRVHRLYVATGNPTENLKTLTEYNIKEMRLCGSILIKNLCVFMVLGICLILSHIHAISLTISKTLKTQIFREMGTLRLQKISFYPCRAMNEIFK